MHGNVPEGSGVLDVNGDGAVDCSDVHDACFLSYPVIHPPVPNNTRSQFQQLQILHKAEVKVLSNSLAEESTYIVALPMYDGVYSEEFADDVPEERASVALLTQSKYYGGRERERERESERERVRERELGGC